MKNLQNLNTTQRNSGISPLLSLVLLAGIAAAQQPDSAPTQSPAPIPAVANYDPATGKIDADYPPHRAVDFLHMKLELTIPDMNTPRASGQQVLSISPIAKQCSTLTLDAKALDIKAASIPGHVVDFQHAGKSLELTFSPPLSIDKTYDLTILYEINDPPLGLIWTPESADWPGRPAQLHTQGQPETNSYWFPCHDYPNEKLTTQIAVNIPAGYVASSNGKFLGSSKSIIAQETPSGVRVLKPMERWEFLQDKPHVNYLVTLVIGKFDVVDVGTKALPMPVYVPPGKGSQVQTTYGRTPQMVTHFEKITGLAYPWAKYAQLVVWNFGAGGMENTSATTMYDTAIFGPDDAEDFDLDGLISHELAHQWYGDLLTCNSWEHIWLNEGFATYLTALWFEERDGHAEYQRSIQSNMDSLVTKDKPEAPTIVGMASKIYSHPWETFRRAANPYSKGASVLHMLRTMLGDDIFFQALRNYTAKHAFKTVETSDFRYELENVSGRSLEQFFTQWVTRPGLPMVDVQISWDESAKTLNVNATQTQRIDGDNPAFEFDLPIQVIDAPLATPKRFTLPVTGKTASASFPLESNPLIVEVDPSLSVLASYSIDQPAERFVAQLASGSSPASCVQAIRALRKDPSSTTSELLRRTAQNRKENAWLRVEAVESLRARGSISDLRSVATTTPDHWQVRETAIAALGSLAFDSEGQANVGLSQITRLLADRAERDSSIKVRAAAIRALGKTKSIEHLPVIKRAFTTDSQSDTIRNAALDAAVDYNLPELLSLVINCTKPSFDSRTRPTAIANLAKLSKHDPELVYTTILALLNDRQLRTSRAAGEALVELNDPRAIPAIESKIKETKAEEIAWQAGLWLRSLSKSNSSK